MRLEALKFIVCPNCAGDLILSSDAPRPAEDGHILTGNLACRACASRFAIRNGVPILLPANLASVKLETASRFAEEWTRWSDLRDYYEQEFFDWVAPLTPKDFKDQLVFEGGCGKGRHTAIVAGHGAKAIVSLDLGESAFVAFAHTRKFPNAHVVIGDLLHPPVRPVFDLAFSVGVLHHLPDPATGAAAVASVVRDRGRVVYWVYGRENNEWITRFVDPVRRTLTSKIPSEPLRALSAVPAAVIWAAIKLFYAPGPDGKGPKSLPYGQYFSSMYDFPFDELLSIVFDQLVTPVAYYLPRAEVERWFEGPGFADMQIRWHNQMSGSVTARKRAGPRTAPHVPPPG